MTFAKPLGAAIFVSAVMCATLARADMTPEQVWQAYKDYSASMGSVITATESRDGAALVLKDVKSTTSKDGKVVSEVAMGELRLTDKGDGSVDVTLPEKSTWNMTVTPEKGEPIVQAIDLTQSGYVTNVSGTPEDMVAKTTAAEITAATKFVPPKGTPADAPKSVDVAVKLSGLDGQTEIKTDGATRKADGGATAQALSIIVDGKDEKGKAVNADIGVAGLSAKVNFASPLGAEADIGKAIAGGLDLGYAVEASSVTGKISADGPDGKVNVDLSGGAQSTTFALSQKGISSDSNAQDFKVTVAGPMPMPVDLSIAKIGSSFAIPVMKSDTAQPAALKLNIDGLQISDSLWKMFDAEGKLPHDPANILLDLSAQLKPLVDLFDEAQMAEFEKTHKVGDGPTSSPPFEADAAKINALQVKALGADLTGTGDFTFDNSGPAPKPTGKVDLSLTGAMKLMDTLSSMGLLPADQVMGYKMMLGMFTVPAGDDAVKTTIEFKDDGMYVNGQKMG